MYYVKLQQELGQAAAALTFRDNTQEFERENVPVADIVALKFLVYKKKKTVASPCTCLTLIENDDLDL